MQTLETLKAARALITPPHAWARGAFGATTWHPFTPKGAATTAQDPAAVCWCSLGSLIKVTGQALYAQADGPIRALAEAIQRKVPDADALVDPSQTIASFNDAHEHDDVLAVFDDAIAHLEKLHD